MSNKVNTEEQVKQAFEVFTSKSCESGITPHYFDCTITWITENGKNVCKFEAYREEGENL